MSDHETSFNLENLQEKRSVTENRIPRSPAVDTYESYANWRQKKFPPKPFNYKAEDYTLPNPQSNNENYLNKNPPNSDFQESSYFPTESQHPSSEKYSNHNPPDLMLPRSSNFSPYLENFTSGAKADTKRSLPSNENNYQRYNPNAFQSRDKESEHLQSPHRMKTSSPVNKISREAQHYLKMYSARSDNPPLNSSLRDSNPRFSKTPNSYSPNSQNSNSRHTGNLRSDQRDFIPNSKLRKTSVNSDPQSNPNAGALQPVRYKSDHRHSFPSCCPMEHKREPENGEIMKGLLKLIDNQNEQIKNLQAQLDRLLNIHEKTLKENTKCICSLEIPRQNPQICMQAYNAALQSQTSSTGTENYNQGHPEIQDTNQVYNEASNRRNVQFEDHSKKTLMERKVSIGVMTSFEFTVQNSPFNLENNDQPVIEDQDDEEIFKEGEKNPSNLEQSRRKQNLFSLMPSPLENIIEDSESHLSSSQQPSSNCLSSCKNGNLQTQSGRYRNTSGNSSNTNNTNNHCNFNNSNSPSNYNTSNQIMRSNQNYSTNQNTPNVQNRRESGQDIETRNQGDGLNFSKQNSSPVTRNEPVNRESISNSTRSGTPYKSDDTGAVNRSPNLYRQEETRRERQDQRIDRRENNRNEDNFQDESLNLSGGQLEVRERIPPSPEPSIHVDMQEYSSEEGSVHTKRTPKVGWTFYNNVLGQVNNILQNSPMEEEDGRNAKDPERREWDNNFLIDTVKATTMDQLKKLGISFIDNNEAKEANKK